jgi:hypothetical protein
MSNPPLFTPTPPTTTTTTTTIATTRPKRSCVVAFEQQQEQQKKKLLQILVVEPPPHLPYGSIVWADFSNGKPWPAILVNANSETARERLPKDVLELLLEERDVTKEFLVWSVGQSGYYLSKRIRSFQNDVNNNNTTMDEALKLASGQGNNGSNNNSGEEQELNLLRQAISQAQYIESQIDIHQRIVGKGSQKIIYASTGLPYSFETNDGVMSTPTKSSSSNSFYANAMSSSSISPTNGEITTKPRRSYHRRWITNNMMALPSTTMCANCSSLFKYPSTNQFIPSTCPNCTNCTFCNSGGEQNNLILCDYCERAEHIFCTPIKIDDTMLARISDESSSYTCAVCLSGTREEFKDQVLFRRVFKDVNMLKEQWLYNGKWYDDYGNVEIPPTSIEKFKQSPLYQTTLSMGISSSGLTAFPQIVNFDDKKLFPGTTSTSSFITELATRCQILDWTLSNGTRLGITQVLNFLPVDVLNQTEERLASIIMGSNNNSTENNTEKSKSLLERFSDKPNTLDASATTKRLKMFFGFRYSYGSALTSSAGMTSSTTTTPQEQLFQDVAGIDEYDQQLASKVEEIISVLFANTTSTITTTTTTTSTTMNTPWRINQLVVNVYVESGATLGVHIDSLKLFDRPICSLRLWQDSTLSFGCAGFAGTETSSYLGIPLKRNTLTIMHGFAADRLKHCIQGKHVRGLTASLLFRQVKYNNNNKSNINNLNDVSQQPLLESLIVDKSMGGNNNNNNTTDTGNQSSSSPTTATTNNNKQKEVQKCVEMFIKSLKEYNNNNSGVGLMQGS